MIRCSFRNASFSVFIIFLYASQVSSEDKFSKMVCSICIKRLEGVHRFAMMAYRTQEKLRSQFYGNIDNTNSIQDDEMPNIKDTQKKTEDQSLLHSILTKVHANVCLLPRVSSLYVHFVNACVPHRVQ